MGYVDRPFDYLDQFYYSFRMKNGKIKDLREYSDPVKIATLIGWDLRLPPDVVALSRLELGTPRSSLSPK